jgi:hypothetical protein
VAPKNKPAVKGTKSVPQRVVMLKIVQRVTDGILAPESLHNSDNEDDDAELIQGDDEANSNCKR